MGRAVQVWGELVMLEPMSGVLHGGSEDELPKMMSSSQSVSTADTTPSSPHGRGGGDEDFGLVHAPDPSPTGPVDDPCTFAESIATCQQDAIAQEYVVALFGRVLERYIRNGSAGGAQ